MKYPIEFEVANPFGLRSFLVPYKSYEFKVVCGVYPTDDGTWEHISVALKNRNPNWDEMCYMKDLFFEDEDECIQFHPKKSQYVNLHNHCLHIWKPPAHISAMMSAK